jgi:hypothetical protein
LCEDVASLDDVLEMLPTPLRLEIETDESIVDVMAERIAAP